jgi:8-oxo-dGTP diphosphatase
MSNSNTAEEREFLSGFEPNEYDQLLYSVDPVIFTIRNNELCILLVQRHEHPDRSKWALPGGRVDKFKCQSLEDACRAKLLAKTGLQQSFIEQVFTEGGATRDPRGWSVTTVYYALVDYTRVALHANTTGEPVHWYTLRELDSLELAFDHKRLIDMAVQRLKDKVTYTSLPVHFLPETFTLTELRRVYEVILGTGIPEPSFRKRILQSGILEEAGMQANISNRPAKLYRLVRHQSHYFPGTIGK